ncbi:MAG: hypothetical protein VYE77_00505 [Planctomycetota bacterium]|nr:hypothetical protein [Planctomycetota bacterium]
MTKKISQARKTLFYGGTALAFVGGVLFCSVFLLGLSVDEEVDPKSIVFRALGGLLLIIVGMNLRKIGERGLAGAGVVLDPEKARKELEPYSRMTGGMAKDALDEAGIDLGGGTGASVKVVMLKCRACNKLNEEDSKFCQECGKPI